MCVGQPHETAALVHAMLSTGICPDFITVDGAEGGTGAAYMTRAPNLSLLKTHRHMPPDVSPSCP